MSKLEIGTRVVHRQHAFVGTIKSVDGIICGNQMYYVDFGTAGSFSVNDKTLVELG